MIEMLRSNGKHQFCISQNCRQMSMRLGPGLMRGLDLSSSSSSSEFCTSLRWFSSADRQWVLYWPVDRRHKCLPRRETVPLKVKRVCSECAVQTRGRALDAVRVRHALAAQAAMACKLSGSVALETVRVDYSLCRRVASELANG